jgi:uncharacterized protein (TIRG00374 family)
VELPASPNGIFCGVVPSVFFVFMAYFANLGIPRSGEVLRASSLRTYEKVPFEKAFGTIVTERVIDLIMLFLIIGLSLLLQTRLIVEWISANTATLIFSVLFLIIAIAGLIFVVRLSSNAKSKWGVKLHEFFKGIQEGPLLYPSDEKQRVFYCPYALYLGVLCGDVCCDQIYRRRDGSTRTI